MDRALINPQPSAAVFRGIAAFPEAQVISHADIGWGLMMLYAGDMRG